MEPMNTMFHKIWGLFHITNFVTIIRPYAFLNLIVGHLPYKIVSATYTLCRRRLIWSMIIGIFCTLLTPFALYWILFKGVYTETSIQLHFSFVYCFGIIVIWTSYTSLQSKFHLLRILSDASRLLSPKTFHNAKWILFMDILRIGLFLSFIFNNVNTDVNYLLELLSFYMFWVALLENVFFVVCLNILRLCLCNVNVTLTDLKQTLINDEPHLLRRIYHTQKNLALLTKLKTLRKQHLELGQIIEMLNETFGMENIVIIVLNVADITFNLYFYLVHNTDDGKIIKVWSVNTEYLFYHIFNIIVMTVMCEKVKDQARHIGFNIHRILVITYDEQISAELELFSMQVAQQNHTILAKGLVLDVTLLTKIAGIITTYLLILIQFLLVKTC